MQRATIAIIEYVSGFLALAIFAGYAFGTVTPNTDRLIAAFKLGSVLAAIEVLLLASTFEISFS